MAPGGKRREREQEAELAAWNTAHERVQWFLTRAESFAGVTNAEDPTIPVQLQVDEHALLVLPTVSLVEPRRLAGHWIGNRAGFTFWVERGAHYRSTTGADNGDEAIVTDTGTTTVTDRRVVFSGTQGTYEWPYDDVLGFFHAENPPWTAIPVAGRDKISGVRYDPAHAEAFRFSLTLGIARFHVSADTLVVDIRRQLNEVEADRPGGVAPQPVPAVVQAPVPVEAVAPIPVTPVAPVAPVPVEAVAPVPVTPVAPVAPVPVEVVAPVPVETVAPVPMVPVPAEAVAPVPAEVVAPVPVAPVAPVPVEAVAPVPVETFAPVRVEPVAAVPVEMVAPLPVEAVVSDNGPAAVPATTTVPAAATVPAPATVPASTEPAATESAVAAVATETPDLPAAGWYHDPYGTARVRWWDGKEWTNHTSP